MKKLLLILFVISFIPCLVFASQPMGGWKNDVEVSGEPITVRWTNPAFQPRCVVWMQNYAVAKIYSVPSGGEVRIERKGTNSIPTKLLVVPGDDTLQPRILDIPVQAKEVEFFTESISKDEAFFWGATPENPFPPPSGPASVLVSVRLLRHKAIYSEFYGSFLWHIQKDGDGNLVEPFYFYSDGVGSVSSKGFKKASDVADALCRVHSGGDCPFVFETTPNSWGKLFQINFTRNPKAMPAIY